MKSQGKGASKISRLLGIGQASVYRRPAWGKFLPPLPESASCPLEREAWPQNSVNPFTSCRSHHVHEPLDTRFRSAARLLQALWREDRGLPIGSYLNEDGNRRKLGAESRKRRAEPWVTS